MGEGGSPSQRPCATPAARSSSPITRSLKNRLCVGSPLSATKAIIGEERALSDLINECGARVLKRIGEDPRLAAEATVLTTNDGASTQLATAREPG